MNPLVGLLQDRLCLVTGAGRGNGRALALGLAAAGARLIATDIDGGAAEGTATELRRAGHTAWSMPLDVSDRAACAALAERVRVDIGNIDILVNNAGVLLRGRIGEPELGPAWDRSFAVNVDGPFNMVSAFVPQLRQTRGAVVNVGSILSYISSPTTAAYAATKGAVLQLTKALASELAPAGIRVNGIAPGMIDTAMSGDIIADPARLAGFMRHVPMARVGQPEELVGAVLFLASPMSSYVTGVMLPVDGGFLTL